jgi:hypothetical protein
MAPIVSSARVGYWREGLDGTFQRIEIIEDHLKVLLRRERPFSRIVGGPSMGTKGLLAYLEMIPRPVSSREIYMAIWRFLAFLLDAAVGFCADFNPVRDSEGTAAEISF